MLSVVPAVTVTLGLERAEWQAFELNLGLLGADGSVSGVGEDRPGRALLLRTHLLCWDVDMHDRWVLNTPGGRGSPCLFPEEEESGLLLLRARPRRLLRGAGDGACGRPLRAAACRPCSPGQGASTALGSPAEPDVSVKGFPSVSCWCGSSFHESGPSGSQWAASPLDDHLLGDPRMWQRVHCEGRLGVRPKPREQTSVFRGLCPGCLRPQVPCRNPQSWAWCQARAKGALQGGGCDQSFGLLAEDPSRGHLGPWTVLNL